MQHIHIIFIVVHTLIISNLQTLTPHSSVVVMVGCFCCSPKNAATDAFLLALIMKVELERLLVVEAMSLHQSDRIVTS